MRIVVFLAACGLAACSSGTSGDAGGVVDPPISDPGGVAPSSSLPLTGRASYSGALTLGVERAGNATGVRTPLGSDLTVAVDFGGTDAQVTGEARNFTGPGGSPFVGSLFLTRGEIDRAATATDPDYLGRVSGTLREGTDSYLVFGQFAGEFKGPGQEVVSGTIFGNVLQGTSQTQFDGTYQAGRVP